MVRAVRQQQPDAVFHLGDCERDTQRLEKEVPDLPLYRVGGNCDREPVNPEVLQLTLDGVKFFGHTHRALSETMQGLYVVNPGTAGVGAMCTYACIETRDGAIRSAGIHAIPEV